LTKSSNKIIRIQMRVDSLMFFTDFFLIKYSHFSAVFRMLHKNKNYVAKPKNQNDGLIQDGEGNIF
jgi:hypothetical protein